MTQTSIEWTDTTWNPVRGCTPVSEGCKNCYAMRLAHRFSGPGKPYEGLTKLTTKGPRWTGDVRTVPELLDAPLRWREPRRVFVNSMSDLFHEDVPEDFIDRVFAVMAIARKHTFQILTKRPERAAEYLNRPGVAGAIAAETGGGDGPLTVGANHGVRPWPFIRPDDLAARWPLPNVWLGTSVEDQAAADERIPHLLRTPAAVRFLSCEPLLGPVDLRDALGLLWERCDSCGHRYPDVYWADDEQWAAVVGDTFGGLRCPSCFAQEARAKGLEPIVDTLAQPLNRVDWVIAGGESGPGSRPCDIAWIESIVDQCKEAGVPVFVKQLGADPVSEVEGKEETRAVNQQFMGGGWNHWQLRDKKGGDPGEWPEHLRVREFPV